MDDLSELLEHYATYMKSLNRTGKGTKEHISRIKRFFTWAEKYNVKHPSDVTQAMLLDYQKYLSEYINERGTTNNVMTQNQHLAVVACFYKYLKQAGYVAHNPTLELQYAKVPQRLPKAVLTHKEMKKLLRQPDTSTVLGFRDRTILEVMYSTGVRRNELLNLDVSDIDLESGFLLVRQGKGSKDRIVPLGKVACKYLETYMNGIRPDLVKRCPDPQTKALFPSCRSDRLRRNTLAELIDKYARRAGLTQGVTPHTFRHTCATALIRNNASIRHVQEMLGHSRLTSTQEYIRLTMSDLKEAHSRFHPREKDVK